MTVEIEMIVDRGMNGGELLQALHVPLYLPRLHKTWQNTPVRSTPSPLPPDVRSSLVIVTQYPLTNLAGAKITRANVEYKTDIR